MKNTESRRWCTAVVRLKQEHDDADFDSEEVQFLVVGEEITTAEKWCYDCASIVFQ